MNNLTLSRYRGGVIFGNNNVIRALLIIYFMVKHFFRNRRLRVNFQLMLLDLSKLVCYHKHITTVEIKFGKELI